MTAAVFYSAELLLYPFNTAFKRIVCQVIGSLFSTVKYQGWYLLDTVPLDMQYELYGRRREFLGFIEVLGSIK